MFILSSWYVASLYRPHFDSEDTCVGVVDGDTFDITGYRVRLADVDAPEVGMPGYGEASGYLGDLVLGETVYLDVDDDYFYDTSGTRMVCVVYVETEPGAFLNVNQALLDAGLGEVDDHDNEFDPASWDAMVYDLDDTRYFMILGASFIVCFVAVFVFDRAVRLVKNGVGKGLDTRL